MDDWASNLADGRGRWRRSPAADSVTGGRAHATLRPMLDMLGPGRRILASQPFSVLVDAELLRLGDGQAELRIPVRAELKQQHGFVHGGVISYAADNALTFAGGSAAPTGGRRGRRRNSTNTRMCKAPVVASIPTPRTTAHRC